jgi:hypothetical protein
MRHPLRVGLLLLALVALSSVHPTGAVGPPARKPLDSRQRDAVLSLITG